MIMLGSNHPIVLLLLLPVSYQRMSMPDWWCRHAVCDDPVCHSFQAGNHSSAQAITVLQLTVHCYDVLKV